LEQIDNLIPIIHELNIKDDPYNIYLIKSFKITSNNINWEVLNKMHTKIKLIINDIRRRLRDSNFKENGEKFKYFNY